MQLLKRISKEKSIVIGKRAPVEIVLCVPLPPQPLLERCCDDHSHVREEKRNCDMEMAAKMSNVAGIDEKSLQTGGNRTSDSQKHLSTNFSYPFHETPPTVYPWPG